MTIRRFGFLLALVLTVAACSSDNDDNSDTSNAATGTNGTGTDGTETGTGGETGETDGTTDGGTTTGGDTTAIAGLWDVSEVDEQFGQDIVYVEISADGKITTYDYQQDEFDAGDNCYIISTDVTLTPLGNGQYTQTEVDEDTQENFESTLTMSRSGDTLTVSYADTEDENDNGDVAEILTFNYPLLTGVDPVFNECTS